MGGGEEEGVESGRKVEVALQEKPKGRGAGEGDTGWERLKPKSLLRGFSTVKSLCLGESSWLEL